MSTIPSPQGRKLLRVEAKNAQTPIEKKPEWIKTTAVSGKEYMQMRSMVNQSNLHTVCAEAGCPNIYECWQDREATFLLGGAVCTRRCDFCDIATGKPASYDKDEPERIANSVKELDLRYATVTGVARDDIEDGAAWLYAQTCKKIHQLCPQTGVELLVDDFKGKPSALETVFESEPEVFAHNLETVPRIFKKIRPAFKYDRSLSIIEIARESGMITKSNLILGMGETREEIESTIRDLYSAGCDILTITQYLRPSKLHHPIDRWVHPKEFVELSKFAQGLGFAATMAGPLVRSSYRAGSLWGKAMKHRGIAVKPELQHLLKETTFRQEADSILKAKPHLCSH